MSYNLIYGLKLLELIFFIIYGKIGFAVLALKYLFAQITNTTMEGMNLLELVVALISPSLYLFLDLSGRKMKHEAIKMEQKSIKYQMYDTFSKLPGVTSLVTYHLEFVGSFTAPYQEPMFDQESLKLFDIKKDLQTDIKGYQFKMIVSLLTVIIITLYMLLGAIGLLIAPFAVIFHWIVTEEQIVNKWKVEPSITAKFNGVDGVYRVYKNFFGYQTYRGIATVNKGIIQTRYHVVENRPVILRYMGVEYQPTSHNEKLDVISWCGMATYVTPEDDQEIVVEIIPPASDTAILYSTTCMKLDTGDIVFKGLKTMGGVSGSPYFVKTNVIDPITGEEHQVLAFAGNIGTNFRNDYDLKYGGDYWQVEVLYSGGKVMPKNAIELSPGGSYQIFDHPGSGKTRIDIPTMVREGLKFCPNVIIAGPTRVVAREIYASMRDSKNSISLNIRGSLSRKKNARIMVTTHSTLLRMLINKDPIVKQASGVIIDEAHFENPHTRMLLGCMRNKYATGRTCGFYTEMTATGYDFARKMDVVHKGSRYHITDRGYDNFDEVLKTVVDRNKGKRILIFVPQVSGPGQTVEGVTEKLAKMKAPHKIIPMYRAVYEQTVEQINVKHEQGVIIVSTSISECGANYDVDVVIDTAKRLAYIEQHPSIYKMQVINVRLSQLIQRRGRVGRRRNGVYYYPNTFEWQNMQEEKLFKEAEDEDEDVFLANNQLLNRNEQLVTTDIHLSPGQIIQWLKSDYLRINSPRTIRLFVTSSGNLYSKEQVYQNIRQEMLGGTHKVQVGGKQLHLRWWDDRDRAILTKYLHAMNLCGREKEPDELTRYEDIKQFVARRFYYQTPTGDDYDKRDHVLVEDIPFVKTIDLRQYEREEYVDDVD